jgi:hypothetical protein
MKNNADYIAGLFAGLFNGIAGAPPAFSSCPSALLPFPGQTALCHGQKRDEYL